MFLLKKLLSVVKRQTNKDWARPVPAAAVIPAVRVASTFIGSKNIRSLFCKSLVKFYISNVERARDTTSLETGRRKEYDRGSGKMC